MSISITELVNNHRINLDPQDIFECGGEDDMKTKYYGAILNSLGSYNTKPAALKKLLSVLCEDEIQDSETLLKLFTSLNKIFGKSGEPIGNRAQAAACLVHLLRLSVDKSEVQKEISSNVSSVINVINSLDAPSTWVPLMTEIMRLFPGPCGPVKGLIWKKLCSEIGSGKVGRSDLGCLFSLSPQLGGGGKEGAEHSRAFGNTLMSVVHTVNKSVNNLFAGVQVFERFEICEEDVISLPHQNATSLAQQTLKLDQIIDLMEIECSLLTCSFPQTREIDCDLLLGQISSLLSVTAQDVLQNDVPQNRILSMMIPALQVQALQLLQALVVSVEEDLIPEVATINNIFIKSLQTATSTKVIGSLYKVLSVYVETLGACTGLQYSLDRLIPGLAAHVTPHQDKILLLDKKSRRGGGGKKKGKGRMNLDDVTTSTSQATLNLHIARPALSCIGSILESIGCILSSEDYLSLSILLVNLALNNQIQDHQALISLIRNIGVVASVQSPSFSSPIRFCLHFLKHSTLHLNQKVSNAAKQALKSLESVLHPGCSTLALPVLQEQDMQQMLAKILRRGQTRDEIAEDESDEEPIVTGSDASKLNEVSSNTGLSIEEKIVKQIERKSGHFTEHFANQMSTLAPFYYEKFNNGRNLTTPSSSTGATTTLASSSDSGIEKSTDKQMKRKIEESVEDILDDAACIQDNIKQITETKRKRKESEKALESSHVSSSEKSGIKPSSNKKNEERDTTSKSAKKESSDKKKENEDKSKNEEELDVQTMLKDFSDKLNENLLPDPWDSE